MLSLSLNYETVYLSFYAAAVLVGFIFRKEMDDERGFYASMLPCALFMGGSMLALVVHFRVLAILLLIIAVMPLPSVIIKLFRPIFRKPTSTKST